MLTTSMNWKLSYTLLTHLMLLMFRMITTRSAIHLPSQFMRILILTVLLILQMRFQMTPVKAKIAITMVLEITAICFRMILPNLQIRTLMVLVITPMMMMMEMALQMIKIPSRQIHRRPPIVTQMEQVTMVIYFPMIRPSGWIPTSMDQVTIAILMMIMMALLISLMPSQWIVWRRLTMTLTVQEIMLTPMTIMMVSSTRRIYFHLLITRRHCWTLILCSRHLVQLALTLVPQKIPPLFQVSPQITLV